MDLSGPVLRLPEPALRAVADADNARKRADLRAGVACEQERARVAAIWLPVLDDLDRAVENSLDTADVGATVRMVRDRAVALLASLGFDRHEETRVPFDPRRHYAVGTRPDATVPRGTVLAVVRPGYGDGDRLLRPAEVVVAGAP